MIEQLQLKNFTAFKDIKLDFSPKINVILGQNGTGKTHLLKAAYALSVANAEAGMNASEFATFLVRLFCPLGNRIGRLRLADDQAKMDARFHLGSLVEVSCGSNRDSVEVHSTATDSTELPLLIPAKEAMSTVSQVSEEDIISDWFCQLFDVGYINLCAALLKNDSGTNYQGDPRLGSILPNIAETIGGRYEFTDKSIYFRQGKYVEKPRELEYKSKEAKIYSDSTQIVFKGNGRDNISSVMTAEGFRKIGTIQRLLENGCLMDDVDSPLFWDEPEANVNPKLMKLVVKTLLDLSRNGKQIILATHDYFLPKWLDLLAEGEQGDHVRFHALYRNAETQQIDVEHTDSYVDINKNSISETFSDITDFEISQSMGGLGR